MCLCQHIPGDNSTQQIWAVKNQSCPHSCGMKRAQGISPSTSQPGAGLLPGGGGVEDTWCLLAAADRKTGKGCVQKHILHGECCCPPPTLTDACGTYPWSSWGDWHSSWGWHSCGEGQERCCRGAKTPRPHNCSCTHCHQTAVSSHQPFSILESKAVQ